MNILFFISLVTLIMPCGAWDMSDLHPKALFTPHESSASQEIIKVTGPTSLTITHHNGPIKVKGWNKKSVALHSVKKGTKQAIENTVITIHKDAGAQDISYIVTPKDPTKRTANVTVKAQVPFDTHVKATSAKGSIKTKNLSRAQSLISEQGPITVVLSSFDIESSVFAHARSGAIIVEAPRKIQAQLSAQTHSGTLSSEIFVTVQPTTTLLNTDYWKKIKKEVHGFLGDGGAPITLEAEYGDIKIIEKK